MGYFYGIRDIELIDNGMCSDPEIMYRSYIFNYYDIENTLLDMYLEENELQDCDYDENEFYNWVHDNPDTIYDLLNDLIFCDIETHKQEPVGVDFTWAIVPMKWFEGCDVDKELQSFKQEIVDTLGDDLEYKVRMYSDQTYDELVVNAFVEFYANKQTVENTVREIRYYYEHAYWA